MALAFCLVFLPLEQASAQIQEGISPVILPKQNSTFSFFNFGSRNKPKPAPAEEPVVVVPKINPKERLARQGPRPEGAFRHFVVFGGRLASDLADGLEDLTADDAEIWVENVTNWESALIGQDAALAKDVDLFLSQNRPNAIFILTGMNDRGPIITATDTYPDVNSLAWQAAYLARIDALLLRLSLARVPVIWVGLPPVEDAEVAKDYAQFNTLYRQRVEAAGFFYVDVWDVFADEAGNFVAEGPNIDGEIVRLRSDDGIGFRVQGKRKLAFFAERMRKRIMGDGRELISGLAPIEDQGDGRRRVILTGLSAQGGTILSGAPDIGLPVGLRPEARDASSLAEQVLNRSRPQ